MHVQDARTIDISTVEMFAQYSTLQLNSTYSTHTAQGHPKGSNDEDEAVGTIQSWDDSEAVSTVL